MASTKRRETARYIKDPNGGCLCSCGCGQKPVKPRKTWFSEECVTVWREKNDPGYMRGLVAQRDKGVCARCGRNADALAAHYRTMLWKLNGSPSWHSYFGLHIINPRNPNAAKLARLIAWRTREGYPDTERTWWEADHVLEVVRGGGQCGLDNYQTLCVPCHKLKTAKLAADRAAERLAEKMAAIPPSPQLTFFE